ncbi:MAG TPA: hypothetical protein VNV16_02040 [Methylibium sp.]|nr:hypothetical protein [Methylibium sp.]
MKLITRFELASRPLSALYLTRREVFNDFARSTPGTADRRTAQASLDNIDAEIKARSPRP